MDFDHDGLNDLITGCFEGGIYLVKGLGRGEFAPPQKIKDKAGEILRLGQFWDDDASQWTGVETSSFKEELGIAVHAVDWDDDGDLDLILGSNGGYFFVRMNEGTAADPQYATDSQQIMGGDEPLKIPDGHAMPTVVDWDGDGLWDILSGSNKGAIYWSRNVGTKGEPKFDAAEILVSFDKEADVDQRVGERTQVSAADFNGDGLLDLLVGDFNMQQPDPKELSEEEQARLTELRELIVDLNRKVVALREKQSGAADEEDEAEESTEAESASREADAKETAEALEKAMAEMMVLREELVTLQPRPKMHGYVWLIEQTR